MVNSVVILIEFLLRVVSKQLGRSISGPVCFVKQSSPFIGMAKHRLYTPVRDAQDVCSHLNIGI